MIQLGNRSISLAEPRMRDMFNSEIAHTAQTRLARPRTHVQPPIVQWERLRATGNAPFQSSDSVYRCRRQAPNIKAQSCPTASLRNSVFLRIANCALGADVRGSFRSTRPWQRSPALNCSQPAQTTSLASSFIDTSAETAPPDEVTSLDR